MATYEPGELLSKLLLGGSEDRATSSSGKGRHESRSRSRSPSEVPQPKKMPKKARAALRSAQVHVVMQPKAKSSPTSPSTWRANKVETEDQDDDQEWGHWGRDADDDDEAEGHPYAGAVEAPRIIENFINSSRRESHSLGSSRPSSSVHSPHEIFWRRRLVEVNSFFDRIAGGGDLRCSAMAVLARHTARLRPGAARSLEEAIRKVVLKVPEAEAEPWQFLLCTELRAAYEAAKSSATAIYSRMGRTLDADDQVRWQLGIASFADLLDDEAVEAPFDAPLPAHPVKPSDGPKGELMLLPISQLRFAHNDQSEHFVHGDKDCSILQLAVELITGLTRLEDVPVFTVCWHADQWYCRSGNRRLAALAMAALFAPHRFHFVWVRRVPTDAAFLYGHASGGRPKLTTHLNGADCQGRWLLIKETGEAVGCPTCLMAPPFGADLLFLLHHTMSGTDAAAPNEDEWEDAAAAGA